MKPETPAQSAVGKALFDWDKAQGSNSGSRSVNMDKERLPRFLTWATPDEVHDLLLAVAENAARDAETRARHDAHSIAWALQNINVKVDSLALHNFIQNLSAR